MTSGAVLIDGHDVREIPLADLRRSLGYVPQENFLFSLSIRENVGFGAPDLTAEQLAEALEISQLSGDVVDFPAGVATMIGERGVTLSGGQKQRAGIARAVAKNPLILVLDDSLSSVDTHTEAAILRGLRGVMAGRTSIVIAHRISTIKDFDQIIALDEGRIVERGAHLELLALGGLYADMYRRQLLAEELAERRRAGGADVRGKRRGSVWPGGELRMAQSFFQEDEILGKAYDARLARRLWAYVRPHRRLALITLVVALFIVGDDLLGALYHPGRH